ncbi:MAG TPA: response regulator [Syntrophales bacterium]|nr:response regulator [Syntrophobacterales bacterium]HNQ00702.1 response regulator [Syntrophales bacterium]HNS54569.1 response regulator [Syntrophales bacterium]HQL89524.1 response regulator [Syntrophales bacterium]
MEKTILIVDDEITVREIFKDFFGASGYRVLTAEGADNAVDILKDRQVDVIFLDLRLFGTNGLELGRRIRRENPLSILFAITGWAGLFEVEECREAGFDDFFVKPVEFDMLQKAVEDAFERVERWRKR